MLKKLSVFLFFTLVTGLQAQKMKMTPIRPIQATARVVGILEGNTKLAVLYITQVDTTNEFELRTGTEVLARFQFDTKPITTGDPILPGVKPNDVISAEMAGEYDSKSGQWNYTVFRYSVLPTKTISTEGDDPPQR